MPWLTGSLQWLFKDLPTPLRPENPIPRVNEKGVVERDLTPKEGYYVFQSYWAERPMIHIYAHTWPIRWGQKDERKTVKIYSNCSTVELFVNGESCGKKTRNSQDFPAAGLRWLVPFREGANHLKAIGQKDGATVSDEISFEYQTAKWEAPVKLDLQARNRTEDVVTVEARLFDQHGIQCLDARNLVRFEASGAGTLIDNMGTDTASHAVGMYNGRAMIRFKTNGGKSFVTVSSEGLPLASIEVA
jgi:beta-galactosidase